MKLTNSLSTAVKTLILCGLLALPSLAFAVQLQNSGGNPSPLLTGLAVGFTPSTTYTPTYLVLYITSYPSASPADNVNFYIYNSIDSTTPICTSATHSFAVWGAGRTATDASQVNIPISCSSPITSGNTYIIHTWTTGNGGTYEVSVDTTLSGAFFQLWNELPPSTIDTGRTYIKTVHPDNEVVATSTPFEITAFGNLTSTDIPLDGLGEPDNSKSAQLSILWTLESVVNSCIDVICAANASPSYSFREPLFLTSTSTQTFLLSTTSPGITGIGVYDITASLQKPTSVFGFASFFGLFSFGHDTIAQKRSTFTVGTSTSLSDVIQAARASIANATSPTQALNSCLPIPGYFDLPLCIYILFIPTNEQYQKIYDTVNNEILARPPWGYARRLISIMTNQTSATSTLPTFTFVMPNNLALGGAVFAFNMEDMFAQGSTTLNTVREPTSNKTIREITEPYIQLIIALFCLIIMFHDVMLMSRDDKPRPNKPEYT